MLFSNLNGRAGLRLVTIQRREGSERMQEHANEIERIKEVQFSGKLKQAARTLKKLEASKRYICKKNVSVVKPRYSFLKYI